MYLYLLTKKLVELRIGRFFSPTHVVTLIVKYIPKYSQPGANPTTLIYSASAVKIYNATNSAARF
jgi:hypothetical protein